MRKEKASFLCLLSDDCELDHRRMDNVINEFVENAPIKGIKIKYGIYKNIDKNLSIATIYDYASMAAETGNSKLIKIRSCPGFPVNSYEPIECRLDGEPFMVNPQEGSFLFVVDWETFAIPKDVVVIGVENMENFRMIRKQRAFFEKYLQEHRFSSRALFVSRYPQSTDLRRWLCAIPNSYLHFGDFDLAGINIFLSDFQKYIGKSRSSY